MERHRELMRTLLNSRERRERKHDISRLSLNEVLGELGYRGCALDGPEISLRERLLRAVFREIEPENHDIPWYPWDDAVVVDDERSSGEDSSRKLAEEEGGREVGENREEPAPARVTEQQRSVKTLAAEDVIVHVPTVSATTSSPIVTQSVTTVATRASSTATVVTPLTIMRTTPGIAHSIFSSQPPPRLLLGRDIRAHVNERDGWSYYSEHYGQGVCEARERQSVPRVGASVEPPRPKAVPREQAWQRWYTPAQDYDGIQNYESASSSSYRGRTAKMMRESSNSCNRGRDNGVTGNRRARTRLSVRSKRKRREERRGNVSIGARHSGSPMHVHRNIRLLGAAGVTVDARGGKISRRDVGLVRRGLGIILN